MSGTARGLTIPNVAAERASTAEALVADPAVAGMIVEGDHAAPAVPGWWSRVRSRASQRLGYALLDQVVYSFGNLVVYAMFRRHGTDRTFGAFMLTQRTLDVIFQLCNVFLWGPFCFNLPGLSAARQRLYRGSLLLQQVTLCAVCASILWGLNLLSSGSFSLAALPVRYREVFGPLIWTCLGITFREYTRRMYFSEMRFREAFWTEVATVVLQIAGMGWLVWRGAVTVGSALTVLSAGAILVSLWWAMREWRTVEINLKASLEDLRKDFQLGRWLFLGNMVSLLSLQCNPWILSSLIGLPAVGAYTVCEYPVNVPRVALTSLQNTMAPSMARRFAEGGRRSLNALVRRFDTLLLAGSAVFVVIAWAAGPWFARLLFKSVPADVRSVVVLLAFNLLALACTMARSYGLTAMGRADLTFYVNLLGLAVQAVAVVPLVHAFHLRGAAMALLLGTATTAAVRALVYAREVRKEVPVSAAEAQPA